MTKISEQVSSHNRIFYWFFMITLMTGLYLTTKVNYILFHSIAELFSVVVAASVFIITWNSVKYIKNPYLITVGISYLFIGILDLLHTLAYKGMPIFTDYDYYANQLWIAARSMEGITLLAAFVLLYRKQEARVGIVFLCYATVTALLVSSIFYWKIFPICFVEGKGLTPFKIYSEYAICSILVVSSILLMKNRSIFAEKIYRLLLLSIVYAVISELSFTFYIDNYGISNIVGHFFKIFSFMMIYRAIISIGIEEPYALIFKELRVTNENLQKEIELRKKTEFDLEAEIITRKQFEKVQQNILQRFYLMLSSMYSGVLLMTEEGRVEFINKAFCDAFGLKEKPADLVGLESRDLLEKILPAFQDPAEAAARVRKILQHGEAVKVEEFAMQGGRTALRDFVPLNIHGKSSGRLWIYTDITEHKRAEQALRESEQFNNAVLDTVGSLVVVLDMKGCLLRFNQACEAATGYSAAEVLGRVFWEFLVPKEELEGVRLTWERLQAGDFPNAHENHWIAKDGARRLVTWTNTAIVQNGKNYIIGSGLDLTERRQVEKDRSVLAAIVDSSEDAIISKNLQGLITSWNVGAEHLLGYRAVEMIGQPINRIVPPELHAEEATIMDSLRRGLSYAHFETVRLASDGRLIPLSLTLSPIYDTSNTIIGISKIARDITEAKLASEQIKAALAEKEVMLKEIHHRVKNNLQVISSLVSLQSDNQTDERMRDELNDVRDRVRSMALIHEKLYQADDLAQLNFADYATSLLHSLWRSHGTLAAKARLNLELTPCELPVAAAVPCGLILNELAGNALKHAFPHDRGGEVTVGLQHDAVTDMICLKVHDNGVGLPDGLDWRQSRSLGLRLVQILAGQLRGTVATGTGPGTEFQITFFLKGTQA